MPPVAYVPCAVDENDERHAVLRYTNDGRIALLVYTALDRLHRCAGDVPWALMDWAGLERIQEDMARIKQNGILGQLLRDSWLAFTEGLL